MIEKDIGFVGEVNSVDASLLDTLVADGYIPVVASVAADANGQALNVNADTAAGEVWGCVLGVGVCIGCGGVYWVWGCVLGVVVYIACDHCTIACVLHNMYNTKHTISPPPPLLYTDCSSTQSRKAHPHDRRTRCIEGQG